MIVVILFLVGGDSISDMFSCCSWLKIGLLVIIISELLWLVVSIVMLISCCVEGVLFFRLDILVSMKFRFWCWVICWLVKLIVLIIDLFLLMIWLVDSLCVFCDRVCM